MTIDGMTMYVGGSRMGSGRDDNRCGQVTQNGYRGRARVGLHRHSQSC